MSVPFVSDRTSAEYTRSLSESWGGEAVLASTEPSMFEKLDRHALTLVIIWFYGSNCQCSEYSIVTP